MSKDAAKALNERLADYELSTGHQVLVWIGKSTGGEPIEAWTDRAFKAWQIGRKGVDDGVILFVFSEDHSARIEVGYGLEDRIPDAVASRLISEVIVPEIRSGKVDAAISRGIDGLLSNLENSSTGPVEPPAPSLTAFQGLLILAGLVLLLVVIVRHPILGYYLVLALSSMSKNGGGGWPSARGKGGRSGGGGASGGW